MPETRAAAIRPELWGGIECTLNRVGDCYHNQLALSGHLERPEDLELIAGLGIRTLRYPVLWEMVAPQSLDAPQWSWPDQRLSRLQRLGIAPVVGLLHHGSGPSYTSLLDPDFPKKIARFARLVARRYPWLSAFTPINEPLTTARFSALYGHWYPHARDDRLFVRALMLQCRGIAEAMLAIREVIPGAQLVATEDLGATSSTKPLRYQAEFENHRRWLSFDLLCGRVGREHPMRLWLAQNGASEEEFDFLAQAQAAPELIGINYYLTSDRFLDDRLDRYPPALHGGNHRHRYVDVEAVRACPEGIVGHERLLLSAWQRYGREVAVTEVHLGSTREEQLRWLGEAWSAGVRLRSKGVPVRAVTAWALFGSFDWNTLCTRKDGHYEPGAFDVRGKRPRPTAVAAAISKIIASGEFRHAVSALPGWWRRPERFLPRCRPATVRRPIRAGGERGGIVIVGKTGTLGGAFARLCEQRGSRYHLLSREQLDIAEAASVAAALQRYAPWAVVNAAGFVRIDEAEDDRERCLRENAVGPELLAAECARRGVALVTFSSDMVFSGRKRSAYLEGDRVSPVNFYGRSKAEAERRVLWRYPQALVVRSSAFFGPWDDFNFLTVTLRRLANGEVVTAASDLIVSPTYVPDLVDATLDLLLDGECGIWHLSNCGSLSWADFALSAARLADIDPAAIVPRPAASLAFRAKRPHYSALGSSRGALLPPLEDALQRYFREMG